MANKLWIPRFVQLLESCLAPVPHEINEVDWKCALSPNNNRVTEHLIALANQSNGGFLCFGIDNTGVCQGVTKEDVAAITNTIANIGRDAIEPPLIIDHAVIERDAPLLVIYVAELSTKPAHKRGKGIEESWIRSGGTTRKAARHEVAALMLNSAPPRWEELRASPLLSLEQVLQTLEVEGIAALLGRPIPNNPKGLLEWLCQEGLTIADGDGLYVTNFGAIAAAKKIDDFDSLARKRIRVIRYSGTNKITTIDEMAGQRGYAIGFEGLVAYLKRVLPHSEVIHQALRAETTLYPEIALRELIANALIHQDFMVTGAGPMVEIFDDRIEVTSPGSLLPSKRPDRLIGTSPESRNERLASSFRQYRICEERGTGFQKVAGAAELFGLPPVLFNPLENAFRVTLYAPRKFSEMDQHERMEACYQHAVLQFLSSKTLTNTTLRERFKLHDKNRNQITNVIADAVGAGRIKRKDVGSGNKFAEYLPYWV